jgi:anaerobic ribonucleoside-triphosphate reductase activating protein
MLAETRYLYVAQRIRSTEAEGPGRRYALWFQGCPLRCPGCCNPEFLPFSGGETIAAAVVMEELRQAADDGIEGISLLGGEPFAHAEGAAMLASAAHGIGLSVMVYTGYTLEALQARPEPAISELLRETDLLVDGPYDRNQPETRRRWIGSANQRIHFLTSRYCADDACWQRPNTLELRLIDGELTVNGFPARSAVGLWKRPTRR